MMSLAAINLHGPTGDGRKRCNVDSVDTACHIAISAVDTLHWYKNHVTVALVVCLPWSRDTQDTYPAKIATCREPSGYTTRKTR